MLELYWGCLIFGVVISIVSVLFGDLIGQIFDGLFDFMSAGLFNTMTIASAVSGFGGAGILLTEYTTLSVSLTLIFSVVIAVFLALVVLYGYVKPMSNSENSTGYSMQDLIGAIGEVLVPIPELGYGEVLVRAGNANSNHPAGSFDREAIQAGDKVVVVEVRDGALYVSRLEQQM